MAGSIIRRFPNVPIIQAILLACIQAFGWLYINCILEHLFYQGGNGLGMGIDVGPIILAWMCALVWGWFVCNAMSKLIIGGRSRLGYLAVAILAIPIGFVLSMGVEPYTTYLSNPRSEFLMKSFYVLGLFGLLPEGHKAYAVYHSLNFYVMFFLGFIGFYASVRISRKRN